MHDGDGGKGCFVILLSMGIPAAGITEVTVDQRFAANSVEATN